MSCDVTCAHIVLQRQPEGTALLSLDSSQVNIAGNYSCVAENLAGNSTRLVQILVASEW